MEQLMQQLGWNSSRFALRAELKSSEQAEALCDNLIDAFAFTVGHPSGAVQEACNVCDSKLLPVSDKTVAQLVKDNPYYRQLTIPGGLYKGTPSGINTIGITSTLVTSSQVPAEVIYQVTRSVFENITYFKKLHPVFRQLDRQSMTREGLTAPLHEGAKRYYQEAGLL